MALTITPRQQNEKMRTVRTHAAHMIDTEETR